MPETSADPSKAPVKLFIVGSARSGTSISYFAAREVLGLPGRGESHVIPIFRRMQTQFDQYVTNFAERKGTLAQDLRSDEFRSYMQAYIRNFYAMTYNGDSFVDKTPGAESVRAVNFILETFPDARILATRRTGIEVVQSYQIKFKVSFGNACRAWVDCMDALEQMRPLCPTMLEVDQYDFTNSPTETATAIAQHVGRPEKADELAAFFTQKRVEQSSRHDWSKRLTLSDASWTDEEKEQFRVICGPKMEAFGYPM